MYNDGWFVSTMQSYGIPDSTFLMYVNPPPVAIVMIPIVWLKPETAKTVWNSINLVLLFVAFELLRRLLNLSLVASNTPLIILLLTCTLPPLRNLQRGQLYILMLVLLILFAQGYLHKRPLLASLPLAVLLLLKYFGWMFLFLFALERRWKELGLTLLFFLVGLLASVYTMGADTYEAHLGVLSTALTQRDFAFTGLPCVPALFGGLFTFHPQWNSNPVENLPWLSFLLTAVSLVTMTTVTFAKTQKNSVTRFSAIIILSVLFTPLAAEHHYMLLILPAAWLILKESPLQIDRMTGLALLVVLFFVLGWYPQPGMNMAVGWAKLMAYPRLYASIILWLSFLYLAPSQMENQQNRK